MAAHHHGDVDAGQGAVVEIGAHERLRDEARRRRIARAVVVDDEVVVDGLGDVDAAQVVAARPAASSATMRTVSTESLPPM